MNSPQSFLKNKSINLFSYLFLSVWTNVLLFYPMAYNLLLSLFMFMLIHPRFSLQEPLHTGLCDHLKHLSFVKHVLLCKQAFKVHHVLSLSWLPDQLFFQRTLGFLVKNGTQKPQSGCQMCSLLFGGWSFPSPLSNRTKEGERGEERGREGRRE